MDSSDNDINSDPNDSPSSELNHNMDINCIKQL